MAEWRPDRFSDAPSGTQPGSQCISSEDNTWQPAATAAATTEQQPQQCVGGPYHPPWWRCHGTRTAATTTPPPPPTTTTTTTTTGNNNNGKLTTSGQRQQRARTTTSRSNNDQPQVGRLYHPPSWRGHSSGRRARSESRHRISSTCGPGRTIESSEDSRTSHNHTSVQRMHLWYPTWKPGISLAGNTWLHLDIQPDATIEQQSTFGYHV